MNVDMRYHDMRYDDFFFGSGFRQMVPEFGDIVPNCFWMVGVGFANSSLPFRKRYPDITDTHLNKRAGASHSI